MSMHGADKALNNLNDNWTEEDYDKYFDAMNLDKKERKEELRKHYARSPQHGTKRDWYKRKVSKEMQRTLDELCNGQRFTAQQEKKGRAERRWDKEVQFNRKISDWVKNCANYMMQGEFGLFCNSFAGTLIFFDGERESMYIKANHTTHDQDDSIYAGVAEALHSADKFTQKIWFKGKNNMLKDYQPDKDIKWVFNIDAPPGPGIGHAELGPYQLDLRDGGYCTRGSHRKVDCVNALILKQEFVLSRRSVRGLGKGSYDLGAKILYQLMGQWEREANKYAQRR
jgi:hypothetical protein